MSTGIFSNIAYRDAQGNLSAPTSTEELVRPIQERVNGLSADLMTVNGDTLDNLPAIAEIVEAVNRKAAGTLTSVYDFMTEEQINAAVMRTLSVDHTDAIRQAFATGNGIFVPKGDYNITGEIEIKQAGQYVEFEGSGGYGYGEDIGLNWRPNTRFVGTGTFEKRLRTNRKWRGSASDPADAPLSVMINIQAEGVILNKGCFWLDCDYSTLGSPGNLNLGADCDVGIFVGCRVGVQMHDCQVIGYFRSAGVYYDITHSTNLPRFNDLDGNPYNNENNISGDDGCHIYNLYTRGGRRGLVRLGPIPEPGDPQNGNDYYSELLGATVPDFRGNFGGSNFLSIGGRIYGPDHHSDFRLEDPTPSGGSLNQTSLEAEPDDMPCAVYLDSERGAGDAAWGMRFIGTRIATFEAFRVRLGYVNRAVFQDCHIEGRSNNRKDTSGTIINTNDYTLHSYGDIASTGESNWCRVTGSPRYDSEDVAPHFYGEIIDIQTDNGRHYIGDYICSREGEELDLRSYDSNGLIRMRQGSATVATISANAVVMAAAGSSTTGTAANAVFTSNGTFQRSTSALKYKTDLRPLSQEKVDAAMSLKPRLYKSLCNSDDKDQDHLGFIADEADEAGLSELVQYNDETGEVESFAYDRMTVIHQSVLQDLLARIEALESKQ